MAASKQVPVSRRALFARINRHLKKDGEWLRASRGERALQDLGEYYVIDISRNFVLHKDVDLEDLGRELGVLAAFEKLTDD